MSYITDKQLEDRIDLPISLPVTEVKRNSWLVLATYAIAAPMKLNFRFLQLQLMNAVVVGGEEGDTETEFSSKLINASTEVGFTLERAQEQPQRPRAATGRRCGTAPTG